MEVTSFTAFGGGDATSIFTFLLHFQSKGRLLSIDDGKFVHELCTFQMLTRAYIFIT